MSINFFDKNCQESIVNSELFGICDDENGQKAYTNTDNPETWIGKVKNENKIELIFTAVDNCIDIKREDGNQDNKCDGMINYPENIVFIELKNQKEKWIHHAVKQLETTIKYFTKNFDISIYTHRKAFACNKKRPHFQVVDTEIKQRFYNKYKFRLNIQADIKI